MTWEAVITIPVCLALCCFVLAMFGWDGITLNINVSAEDTHMHHTFRHLKEEDDDDE